MVDPATLAALQIFQEERHASLMGIGSSKEGFSVYGIMQKCITHMVCLSSERVTMSHYESLWPTRQQLMKNGKDSILGCTPAWDHDACAYTDCFPSMQCHVALSIVKQTSNCLKSEECC
eukprot:scaffold11397_cov21-Tisochrysis_lutea.AAC.2